MTLIDSLIEEGWLKTPRIIEAFKKIKRVDFLPASLAGGPEDLKDLAELNAALSIGYGQTISQPLVVAFMLEQLQPQRGDKILDIGSGSGWTSALLAYIVSSGELNEKLGKVIAIDIVPELVEFGKKNVAKYNFIEKGVVEFICADGSKGYPNIATRPELAEGFDKILVSAAAERVFPAWKEQLKISGRIVASIGSSIWLFVKKGEKKGDEPSVHLHSALRGFVFEEIEYPGFAFVPLITK